MAELQYLIQATCQELSLTYREEEGSKQRLQGQRLVRLRSSQLHQLLTPYTSVNDLAAFASHSFINFPLFTQVSTQSATCPSTLQRKPG